VSSKAREGAPENGRKGSFTGANQARENSRSARAGLTIRSRRVTTSGKNTLIFSEKVASGKNLL
jgi:hypothetical protein